MHDLCLQQREYFTFTLNSYYYQQSAFCGSHPRTGQQGSKMTNYKFLSSHVSWQSGLNLCRILQKIFCFVITSQIIVTLDNVITPDFMFSTVSIKNSFLISCKMTIARQLARVAQYWDGSLAELIARTHRHQTTDKLIF